MPLPLNDENNPLYGHTFETQCTIINQWQQKKVTPLQLFSLTSTYSKEELTKAYRHLAKHFHPDKNAGAPLAESAFKIITEAYDYLVYQVIPVMEKTEAFNKLQTNIFYKEYGLPNNATDYSYSFDWSGFDSMFATQTPQKKAYSKMSFFELAEEALQWPIPLEVVEGLKNYIRADKHYLTVQIKSTGHEGAKPQNILTRVAGFGNLKFFRWLIEEGASVYTDKNVHWDDVISIAALRDTTTILAYLLQRFGKEIFYTQPTEGAPQPIWSCLEETIRRNRPESTLFLLENAGYAKYLKGRSFNNAWYDLLRCSNGSEEYMTSVCLQYNLVDNAKSSLYWLLHRHGHHVLRLILDDPFIVDGPRRDNDVFEPLDFLTLEKLLKYAQTGIVKEKIQRYQGPIDDVVSKLKFSLESLLHEVSIATHQETKEWFHQLSNWSSCYALARVIRKMKSANTYTDNSFILILQILPYLVYQLATVNSSSREEKTLINKTLAETYDAIINQANWSTLKCKQYGYEHLSLNTLQLLQAIHPQSFQNNGNLLMLALWNASSSSNQVMEDEMHLIILWIISLGGKSLIQPHRFETRKHTFTDCTPLHFAIQWEHSSLASSIFQKMCAEKAPLNAIMTRSNDNKAYHYSYLHLAIEQGQESLAVNLIRAGTDIHLKAIVEKTTSLSLFGYTSRKEKTPLQMAIQYKQSQVIYALQLALLDEYIKKREQEEEYLTQIKLFSIVLFALGCISFCGFILGFGNYSRTTKLEEARKFRNLLISNQLNNDSFDALYHGPLAEGRLGDIAKLSTHYLKTEPVSQSQFSLSS